MNKSNYNADEELLLAEGEDTSEPWHPIRNQQAGASGYSDNYIPLATEVERKMHPTEYREYRDHDEQQDGFEEPPDYYTSVHKPGPDDDVDLLVPEREDDDRRPRWNMGSNPYQTPRFYDDRMLNMSHGYPQHMSAMNSSVSNNIVVVQPGHSSATIVVEEIKDYTCLSVFVLLFCCLPLGVCALIKAQQSQTYLAQGNRLQAHESAYTARNLSIAGMIVGPILITIIVLLNVFVFHAYGRA
ncbi:proline-rich transmembrane protein 1-like isoform X1 [Biomphalaria glabrata]|nr:synapse differentiation-inducing gene protein 1-like [Biomphalaria glabrata]